LEEVLEEDNPFGQLLPAPDIPEVQVEVVDHHQETETLHGQAELED
jgi:hypothetical protein